MQRKCSRCNQMFEPKSVERFCENCMADLGVVERKSTDNAFSGFTKKFTPKPEVKHDSVRNFTATKPKQATKEAPKEETKVARRGRPRKVDMVTVESVEVTTIENVEKCDATTTAEVSREIISSDVQSNGGVESVDTKPNTTEDVVNHPSHYNRGGIECITMIEAMLTPEEFRGYLKGNAMKYLYRSGHKGDAIIDLQKQQWYTKRLEQAIDKERRTYRG